MMYNETRTLVAALLHEIHTDSENGLIACPVCYMSGRVVWGIEHSEGCQVSALVDAMGLDALRREIHDIEYPPADNELEAQDGEAQ